MNATTALPAPDRDHDDDASPGQPGPGERVFEGVALVADAAGFTRLSEKLASTRPDGLEQVVRRLDRGFRDCFQVVERHGGQVAAGAGDALVALFGAGGEDPAAVARAARDCAGELLRLFADRDEDGGDGDRDQDGDDDRLLIHIGLGEGRIWLGTDLSDGAGEIGGDAAGEPGGGRVGGWIVGGHAVREASRAVKAARPGEAMLSAALAVRLGLDAPAPGAFAPLLDAIVAPGAPENPRRAPPGPAAASAWSAELRTVAAMFIRLGGFDESCPGSWARCQQALRSVREVAGASRASGRLVIDEIGLQLVVVFGEPTGARAELPEQTALQAAEMVQRLLRAGFSTSAGMAFGRAYCGYLGGAGVRQVLVTVGPCMNLAARLMDQGGGGLLVAGAPTLRLDRAGWSAGVEVLRLKGFREPVQALRLDPGKAPLAAPARLVGRREELERIEELLRRARAGRGGVALIRGDAGMGKTALLAAVTALARGPEPIALLLAESREADRALPYQPWRRVLRALYPELGSLRDEALRAALLRHLQTIGQAAALAPLLNGVFATGFPETPQTEALTGKNRAEAVLDLLFELVSHGVTGPLALVFEDVHLADSPSLRLIDRVGHRLPGLLLILAARPSPQASELIYRLSGVPFEQIDLQPLTAEDVASLVRGRLPGGEVDDEVVALISQSAEGNALFAQEYLVLLQESGRIALADGRWRLRSEGELIRSPETVLATVGSRIHALPLPEQVLIKSASVVGEAFSREMLTRIRPPEVPDDLVEAGLERLERSGLINRTSGHTGGYRFSHAIIREAVYGLMLFDQKAGLHAEVGRILEQKYRQEVSALLPALVHHFDGARDDARVIKFGDLAAGEAMRQGAYREAIDFLGLCLAAADRLPAEDQLIDPRVRWYRQMSEASLALGDLAGMRASAEAALGAAGQRPRRSATAAKLLGAAALIRRALWPGVVSKRRKRAAADWPLERELAQVNQQLALSCYFRGERSWILYYTTRTVRHAEQGGGSVQLAYGLALTAGALGLIRWERAALRHHRVAERAAAAAGDRPAAAFIQICRGHHLLGQGRWSDAIAHLDLAQKIALEAGDRVNWCNAQAVRYWKHSYLGEDAEAMAAAQALWKAAEVSGNRQHQGWGAKFLGMSSLRRGQIDEAVAHLSAARRFIIHHENLNEVVTVMGTLAAALDAQGRVEEAHQIAASLLKRLHAEGPTGHSVLSGCSDLALVVINAVRRGDRRPEALAALRQAVRVVERYGATFPIGRARAALLRGIYWELLGRPRRAACQWKKGLVHAERLGMKPDASAVAEMIAAAQGSSAAGPGAGERILATLAW